MLMRAAGDGGGTSGTCPHQQLNPPLVGSLLLGICWGARQLVPRLPCARSAAPATAPPRDDAAVTNAVLLAQNNRLRLPAQYI